MNSDVYVMCMLCVCDACNGYAVKPQRAKSPAALRPRARVVPARVLVRHERAVMPRACLAETRVSPERDVMSFHGFDTP